jgi:hypothetical protein
MIEHAPRHTGLQGYKYPSSVPIPLISNFNSLSSLLLSRLFFLVFLLFSSFDFFLDSNKTKKEWNLDLYEQKEKGTVWVMILGYGRFGFLDLWVGLKPVCH